MNAAAPAAPPIMIPMTIAMSDPRANRVTPDTRDAVGDGHEQSERDDYQTAHRDDPRRGGRESLDDVHDQTFPVGRLPSDR